MAEPAITRTMDKETQAGWEAWATGVARKETDRQLQVAVAAIGTAIGDLLVPINARLAALESEVAFLRALGPTTSPAKGKGKGK